MSEPRNPLFRSAFGAGETAAERGSVRSANPYLDTPGNTARICEAYWFDGYDAVANAEKPQMAFF